MIDEPEKLCYNQLIIMRIRETAGCDAADPRWETGDPEEMEWRKT